MSSSSSQRIRKSFSDIPGMQQPDDSPPRSIRGMRTSSIPLTTHSQSDIQLQQQLAQPAPYPPPSLAASQAQHVPPPISQAFSASHSTFTSHADQGPEHSQAHAASSQPTPPLTFPRPVQRVPAPPLIGSDTRFNTIRDDWTMTDQLLAEIDRAAHDQEASTHLNMTGIGAGAGQPQHAAIVSNRARERKDSPREGDAVSASAGTSGSAMGRSGSLRQQSARGAQTQQQQQQQQTQSKNETPPQTPPHVQTAQTQGVQRPLLASERSQPATSRSGDREQGSPTYYSSLSSHHSDISHYAQPQPQTQARDNSPPFRYDERQQTSAPPSKTKTPDRSLPVQEENEAEEDVTITPSIERERVRERERQRDLDLEGVSERSRQINHRLPTPQFSSSPMMPPDHIQSGQTSSDIELSSTVQGDDYNDNHDVYDNTHDGRSSRVGHRVENEDVRRQDQDDGRRHVERGAIQQEVEDQEEAESYTPRSHHASLPQVVGGGGVAAQSMERVVYNTSQFHFRPRTASSDAGGMVNLDAAVLRDAIEKLQNPYAPAHEQQQSHSHTYAHHPQHPGFRGTPYEFSPLGSPLAHGQHAALPAMVPTSEEIRGMVNDPRTFEAWQRHLNSIRPGAPVPPTPPNATGASLTYSLPPFSPPPMRSTPYPYSYPYQPLVHHRSQEHPPPPPPPPSQQHILQHMQLFAMNGMQTDSTFSPSSTPYPSYDYNPFLPEHFRHAAHEASMSMRSSPSHFPVTLPVFTPSRKTGHARREKRNLRRVAGSRELVGKLPPRGESTEPKETSPESSDEEGDGDGEHGEYEFNELVAQLEAGAAAAAAASAAGRRGSSGGGSGGGGSSENTPTERRLGDPENGAPAVATDAAGGEDEAEWVDEDEDGDDDLLHLEYHPNYVVNPDKRRKRWELKWDALVKAFRALDRQTDSTLLLLAAPTHGKSLYAIRSRSLRRIPSLAKSPAFAQIQSAFYALAAQRQTCRAQTRHMSLAERFERYATAATTGSSSEEGSSETREEELKGALGAALSSLSALSSIYESREQRWRTEMGKMGEERERVEVLLRQALGMGFGPGVL